MYDDVGGRFAMNGFLAMSRRMSAIYLSLLSADERQAGFGMDPNNFMQSDDESHSFQRNGDIS